MRRSDREVRGLQNILAILEKCEIIRIGMCSGGKPYVVPVNFAFETVGEKLYIYFHCAGSGRKIDIMSENPDICFEADCSFKILKNKTPCMWSCEFESVIGEGRAETVVCAETKAHALDLLMNRFGFEGAPVYTPEQLAAVTVIRIAATSISGKRNI